MPSGEGGVSHVVREGRESCRQGRGSESCCRGRGGSRARCGWGHTRIEDLGVYKFEGSSKDSILELLLLNLRLGRP